MDPRSAREWITHAEAAAIVGCGLSTIDRRQRAGDIARRHVADRKVPSLNRASVEAFAEQWKREQAEKQQVQDVKPPDGPPDDGDVWLDSTTASLVVGVSPQYLGRLALQGRLPAALDRRRPQVVVPSTPHRGVRRRQRSSLPLREDADMTSILGSAASERIRWRLRSSVNCARSLGMNATFRGRTVGLTPALKGYRTPGLGVRRGPGARVLPGD